MYSVARRYIECACHWSSSLHRGKYSAGIFLKLFCCRADGTTGGLAPLSIFHHANVKGP
uniref:Uncharacterized protein n=1 Tax=Anguilla anguilla TaxID=7936 RepID=A0A0E9RSL5_ANGAN